MGSAPIPQRTEVAGADQSERRCPSNASREEAEVATRLQREEQVHQSRQDVAEATALLHQLKRQFG